MWTRRLFDVSARKFKCSFTLRGYELTDKDYRELYLLRERFGVEPPKALLAQVLAAARHDDAS